MKFGFLTALVFGVMVALAPMEAEAKRFGGGKSSGMQRAAPAKPTPTAPAAAPNPGPGAGAAATPKRSWMGPIAGLAAGLGLAALFSHLGMGEGLANFVMMALLAVVAFVAIRFVMRRLSGNQGSALATAGAGSGMRLEPRDATANAMARSSFQPAASPSAPGHNGIVIGAALGGAASGATTSSLPADFDAEGFGRIAKMIFIRMQAANDSADLNDLRTFTTPELFASLRMDLLERGDQGQQTDVIGVDATVLDCAEDNGQQIVSVRFEGSLREQAGAEPTTFNEVWHLVKPTDAEGAWRIAGVQQAN